MPIGLLTLNPADIQGYEVFLVEIEVAVGQEEKGARSSVSCYKGSERRCRTLECALKKFYVGPFQVRVTA